MDNNHLDTIERIAESENDLGTLKALRQKIAKALDSTKSARDIAALTRQMVSIVEKIAELESQADPEDPIKELLERGSHAQVRDGRGRAIHGAHKSQEGEAGEL